MTDVPKASPANRQKEEGLQKKDRLLLICGIGFALFGVLALGLLMYALEKSGGITDPDAQMPIIAPDYPRHLVDFSLVNQSGHAVTRKDLEGKIVVVNFVFTNCAAVCPYINAQMEKIQQLTVGQPNLLLLSLTMDPVDDTPSVLTNYGRSFGQDDSRWSFLTGDEYEMRRFVGTSFLPPDTTGEFNYMPGNFAHTQRIALVDQKGHLVEYFDGLNQNAADAVVKEIEKLERARP